MVAAIPLVLIFLVTAAIVVALGRWMLRRRARAIRLSFREEDGRIIYQPRGGLGPAYLVSAEARDLIILRNHRYFRVVIFTLALTLLLPLIELSTGFAQAYATTSNYELVIFVLGLIVGLAYWRLRIYPLYASTPTADRLSASDWDRRAALSSSWGAVLGNSIISLVALAYGLYCGFLWIGLGNSDSNVTAVLMTTIGLLAAFRTVKLALAKHAQANHGAKA